MVAQNEKTEESIFAGTSRSDGVVRVPRELYRELKRLAELQGIPLRVYLRRTLECLSVIGHRVHGDPLAALENFLGSEKKS